MEAAIERIQNIIDRLGSRFEKLEEMGVETTDAKAGLASAQISVDNASAEIATIDEDVAAAIGSEDARAAWPVVKEKFSNIRDHLKTAHSELRNSVAAVKEAVKEANPNNNGAADAVTNRPTTEPDLSEDTEDNN
jgi:uncharacterized protein (DUF2342 family)